MTARTLIPSGWIAAFFVAISVVLLVQPSAGALDFMHFHDGEPALWRAEDMPIPYWIDVQESPWTSAETIALIRSVVEEMELPGTYLRFEYMGEWKWEPASVAPSADLDAGRTAAVAAAPSGPVSVIRVGDERPRASITPANGRITSFTVWMPGPRDSESFRSLLLHELGHALGFSHNLDASSTMYSVAAPDLNAHDRRMLERFYGDRTFEPLTPLFPYDGAVLNHPVSYMGGSRLQFYWEPLTGRARTKYEVVFSRSPQFDDDVVRFANWENTRPGAPDWCLCVDLDDFAAILPWFDSGEAIYWRVEAETTGGKRIVGEPAAFRTQLDIRFNAEFRMEAGPVEALTNQSVAGTAQVRLPVTVALSPMAERSCTMTRGAEIGIVGRGLHRFDAVALQEFFGDLTLRPGEARSAELVLPDALGVVAQQWRPDAEQEMIVVAYCSSDGGVDRAGAAVRFGAYRMVEVGEQSTRPSGTTGTGTTGTAASLTDNIRQEELQAGAS